jgi:hypothetical protein
MADDPTTLMRREYRLAHRLSRLFRIERTGRVDRWPGSVADQLHARRSRLIDEMLSLEAARRALEPGIPPDLAGAMSELAREAGCAEEYCLQRLAEVGAELGRRRGASTGLRDGGGQVLGRV